MALKNYTTKVSAKQSIAEIQDMLQKHGAIGVLTEYEQGDVQMALIDLRTAELQQIFLPYAVGESGKSLYESFIENPGILLIE